MARVFVSYVREDIDRGVLSLVSNLRSHGIDVWIDRERIAPGARWEDEIRRGIASGDFFIACFSTSYARKNSSFMNEELTQAIEQLRRRPSSRAWFIPVLIDHCEVPDRSIGGGETLRSIQWVDYYRDDRDAVRRIVRAILPDELVWTPHEIGWFDGSTLVVLPLRPDGGFVAAVSKYPVTNQQYREFVAGGSARPVRGVQFVTPVGEPVGEHVEYRNGTVEWTGPFYPWRTNEFSGLDQPVVCVTYEHAVAYARWMAYESRGRWNVRGLDDELRVIVPTATLWEFAAFGVMNARYRKDEWLRAQSELHTKAKAPAAVDRTGARTNSRGVSDLFGNVWEWCLGSDTSYMPTLAGPNLRDHSPELRGGGFLDDLSLVDPFLSADQLKDREYTRHSDLGFRIAVALPRESVQQDVLQRLAVCPTTVSECWVNRAWGSARREEELERLRKLLSTGGVVGPGENVT